MATWGRASELNPYYGLSSDLEVRAIQEKNKQDVFKLPYFQSCMFATVLEDIITELYILVECNSEMRLRKTMIEMPTILARKYGVEEEKITDELADINPKTLDCSEYKLKKLQSDRCVVLKVLQDTYFDLARNRNFDALNENVSKMFQNNTTLKNLIEVDCTNRIIRRDLNRQIRQQRNHMKSVTYDTDNEIQRLKSSIEDAELTAATRSRYIEGWQRARKEQHIQTISDKEIGPTQTIEELKRKADQEQRVHAEIELLINIKVNELQTEVEQWMSKYDKDMEQIDLKIQLKKNDYENMLDKRLEHEETIEKHAELIKNWIKFKEDREAARQYREKMTNSAIIVQAWWRGLLVRQQLGPYKVVKKKGQVKEEKSGKKKK